MYKVTREVLTSTSERRSGFDTADDEFETDDDRGLRARSSNSYRIGSRSKDFRSTDEDADFDDWQETDTFAKFHGASATLNSTASGHRSRSATLDDKSKCTCCPYGYHVDLDFLKHLNADEYENVMNDPRYLLKHHRRLHQMQQQQFQQRASSASAISANIGSISAASSSQFQQQQQYHQQQQQQYQQQQQQQQYHHQQQQQTSQKTYQHRDHQQQHQYHLQQQQQQSTLRSKSPHTITTIHPQKDEQNYENAVAIYNKSAATGTNTLSSTTRTTLGRDRHGTNGFYPTTTVTNGYDPDGVRRQENVYTAEDGSVTTKVIEEVHRTRTTIINLDSEEDETDDPQKHQGVRRPKPASSPEPTSPGYEKEITFSEEKLLPRQQHLIELQKKLQQIQPVDQRGPLKTYVNAADPKPVHEEDQEDPEKVFRPQKPTFRPRPEEEEEEMTREPVNRSQPDPDPKWLREKEELLKKINEMEQNNLKDKREKDDYDRRIRELEHENRRTADDYKNRLSLLDRQMKSKEKVTRDVGIGDLKVDDETYTTTKHFQVVGTGQQPVRIHEKELNTEETTEIREKEVKTIFVSGIDDKFSLATANQPSIQKARPVTKSIGVGDGNVFDDSQSRLEVHEKELRTVFIGGPEQGKVATRNVGILCKAAMRDVGMVHTTEDEKPLLKNASVGVGEIGVSETDTVFREGGERALVVNQNASMKGAGDEGDESYYASSGFCQTTLTNIKASGLKGDNLKAYLEEVLKRKVHSVATQCQFSTENKGTDAGRVGYDIASVGVSEDTVDVDVRPVKIMKSVAIDHRPSLFHRCTGTELMFKLDVGTNTKPQETFASTATNTDPKKAYPAATMTDPARQQNAQTGTELPIFFALDQYRTTGVMTDDVNMYNKRVNTETEEETRQRIGTTMTSSVMESSTSETSEAREIRRGEEQATGYRRYVEETVTPGYLISHTRTSRSRTNREGSSPSRPSSSGRADSRTGYTTTTLIHTRDKSPRRVTFETGGVPTDSTTSHLLGIDRISKTTKSTGVDGVSQFVTETTGPGYTEKVVRESYSTTGKTIGIPLAPGVAGFPKEFFTEDGTSSMASGSSTYISTNQTSSPIVPERISKTRTVSGASSTLTKTEIDEKTGMKRYIKETKGPGYSETTVKSSYSNIGGDGTTFGLELSADPTGRVPSQSVKGPYYTEKTVTTSGGDLRGAATIDLEFVAGKDGSSLIHTSQDSKHYVTEVQCPGHTSAQIIVNEPIPIQIDESGVSVSGSTGGHVIKSTEKRTYSASSAVEGSVKGTGAQTGIKTVIRESYGPNHIKTVTTEKIDIKTGKVISSSTTQSHYDTLPKFEESSSATAAKSSTVSSSSTKTSFDFARSSMTSERFVPDQELGNVCSNYSIWIKDNSKFTQAQLLEMESVIVNRWFHAASGEASNVHLVKSFIAYLNDLSPELLNRVINSTDENGNTVLHFALSHSRMDIVQVVLDTGLMNVNHANKVGNTPILISALAVEPSKANLDVLHKLFSLGNVNARTQGSGQTALMLATGRGRIEIVELLLSKCCQCDVNAKDSEGFTALICAAQKGHIDIVKLLLATGKCDVHIKNNDGHTALDVAKQVGHEFIVSQLESHIKGLLKK